MKQLTKKLLSWLRTSTLDKKVSLMMVVTILFTNIALLAVTSASAVSSLTQKSLSLATQQITSLSESMESTLQDYRDLIMLLMLDDRIQSFLSGDSQQNYAAARNSAYQSIAYIRNAKPSISYIMIAQGDGTANYIYHGINMSVFREDDQPTWPDYPQYTLESGGTLRFRMQPLDNGQWMLQMFQPIYDKYRLGKSLGYMCLGIEEQVLSQFCSAGTSETALRTRINDSNGAILYDLDEEHIGTREAFAGQLKAGRGNFTYKDNMVVYHNIGRWGMRLVGTISLQELRKDSDRTTALLLGMIGLLTLLTLFACMWLIKRLCAPLGDAVAKMQEVSSGNLHARMDESVAGDDFREISENFNRMVRKLQDLMERIKLEEQRNQQIRFNILQSQIQPHFLYNTLECVHWQAAANGDKEVSEMVTALASYYRLCLSKGQDVIPLWQEITLVKSYLTIQNMRYDNIIQLELDVDEALKNVMLPKMTLQPLVENSIYHGIKDRGKTHGTVHLRAYADGEVAVLVYSDNGAGMPPEKIREINESLPNFDASFGYGVGNVHKRIEILFAKGYGLHYSGNETGGLTVEIRFPITWPTDYGRDM